jgi:hypothetical protein
VIEEIDAGAELIRRLDRSFPVQAAFWVKESEEGPWYLYVASDQIRDNTIDAAYGEVLRLAWEMGNPFLDPFRVKLIATSDPLAQSTLEIHRQFPRSRMATRLGGTSFGGMGVDGVYLYPAPLTTTAP